MVSPSFVKSIQNEINLIEEYPTSFFDFDHKDENEYNVALSTNLNALCLDAKNLTYGGGSSKIEVCDILTQKKEFIHIKKSDGSSSLSHLFAQGFVSAELFVQDKEFRKMVRDKLLNSPYDQLFTEERPPIDQYSVVYGIVTTSKKKLSIPFFSKINLKIIKRVGGFN